MGLRGEFTDFLGDDGKAFTVFACASRLDSGVQCKEICLFGDSGDSLDNLPDLLAVFAEFLNDFGRRHNAFFDSCHTLDGKTHKLGAFLRGDESFIGSIGDDARFFFNFLDVGKNYVDVILGGVNIVHLLINRLGNFIYNLCDVNGGIGGGLRACGKLFGGGGDLLGVGGHFGNDFAEISLHKIKFVSQRANFISRSYGQIVHFQVAVG